MPSSPWHALPTLLLLTTTASAVNLDCERIRADGQTFNLGLLGGPKTVHYQEYRAPNIHNTTFTIDVCSALKRTAKVPKGEECPSGTRVCGIEQLYNLAENTVVLGDVIPIAGDYPLSQGGSLDPEPERLKEGKSNSDAAREGLRLTLHGGKYGKVNQKAIVEFICDPDVTGNEGFEEAEEKMVFGQNGRRSAAKDDADDDGDDSPPELPDLDEGKSLQYISYKDEGGVGTLRMTWKTKYACEGAVDKDPEDGGSKKKKSNSWGFFTWFLIILFLLAAAYIIFGSWLNYNRYGARGWDLLPHGDTIRDLPYLIREWVGGLIDRLKGSGGSRGGYSAV